MGVSRKWREALRKQMRPESNVRIDVRDGTVNHSFVTSLDKAQLMDFSCGMKGNIDNSTLPLISINFSLSTISGLISS